MLSETDDDGRLAFNRAPASSSPATRTAPTTSSPSWPERSATSCSPYPDRRSPTGTWAPARVRTTQTPTTVTTTPQPRARPPAHGVGNVLRQSRLRFDLAQSERPGLTVAGRKVVAHCFDSLALVRRRDPDLQRRPHRQDAATAAVAALPQRPRLAPVLTVSARPVRNPLYRLRAVSSFPGSYLGSRLTLISIFVRRSLGPCGCRVELREPTLHD